MAVAKALLHGNEFGVGGGGGLRNHELFSVAVVGAQLASHVSVASLDNPIVRLLMPLWGVAFVAGFILACHR